MDDDQNTGVTEARFALTLVICVLAAIGFITLLRLGGGASHSPVEVRPEVIAQPTAPAEEPLLPHVLPVDAPGTSMPTTPEIAIRPDVPRANTTSPGPQGSPSTQDGQRR